MFLLGLVNTICFNWFFQYGQITGLSAQNAISFLIFKKALKLSSKARKNFDAGKITNMISTDCQRVQMYFVFVNILWTGPLQMAMIIGLMLWQLGPSVLAGVGMLALVAPFQGILFKKLAAIRKFVVLEDR